MLKQKSGDSGTATLLTNTLVVGVVAGSAAASTACAADPIKV